MDDLSVRQGESDEQTNDDDVANSDESVGGELGQEKCGRDEPAERMELVLLPQRQKTLIDHHGDAPGGDGWPGC